MKMPCLITAVLLALIPAASFAQLKPEQTLNRRPISEPKEVTGHRTPKS